MRNSYFHQTPNYGFQKKIIRKKVQELACDDQHKPFLAWNDIDTNCSEMCSINIQCKIQPKTNKKNPTLREYRLRWNIWKNFFTVKVMRHCHRWPREAVEVPSLEMFQDRLDGALSNTIYQVAKEPPYPGGAEIRAPVPQRLVKSLLLFCTPDSLLSLWEPVLQGQLQRCPLTSFSPPEGYLHYFCWWYHWII